MALLNAILLQMLQNKMKMSQLVLPVSLAEHLQMLKGTSNLYLMHYWYVVITFFNTDFLIQKSAFFTYSFGKLVLFLFLCFICFLLLCFEFDVIFKEFTILLLLALFKYGKLELVKLIVGTKFRRSHICLYHKAKNRVEKLAVC